jgi:uncharacterized protein YndB with AHSA1/START domain
MNESKPVNVEVTITASAEKVWQVLTNVELIPKFMMPVKNFKPEIGNEFTFTGSNNGKEYPTHCRIIELIVSFHFICHKYKKAFCDFRAIIGILHI